MGLTHKTELTVSTSRAAAWALLSAAVLAWTGVIVDLVVQIDHSAINEGRFAVSIVLLGIVCGIANIAWNWRSRVMWRQWLLVSIQITTGLVALYLSERASPGTMLIIGMAQIPARTPLFVIAAFFAVSNLALGGMFLFIEGTTSQAVARWFLFVGFQLFALTIAIVQQRERAAREALGVVNAELVETRRLLADSARAEERLRVSRELHDVAGHTLIAMTVSLEAQIRKAPTDVKDALLATRDLSRDLLDDIRAVVSHLRQHDDENMPVALRKLCDQFPSAHIRVSGAEDVQILDAGTVTSVVRCIQEAVANAMRHGEARNIWIRFQDSEQEILLTVQDDGTGGTNYQLGNGLRGIMERVAAFGGQFDIKASDSAGWLLRLHISKAVVATKRLQE